MVRDKTPVRDVADLRQHLIGVVAKHCAWMVLLVNGVRD